MEQQEEENQRFEEIVNQIDRRGVTKNEPDLEEVSPVDVGSLLNHLTDKFTRMLAYVEQQDA